MPDDATYPATVGQISVWRDIEAMPPPRRWEASLAFLWDLPPGPAVAPDAVWRALARLARRHGSLRTTYTIDESGRPRQRLRELDDAALLAEVRQPDAEAADRAALEERELQREIDVTRELPWRAWLLLDRGRPAQVLVIANHMATDGAAALVMRDDFLRLLDGADLPPAPGPAELALEQQGEGGPRLRAAERYWRKTLAAAPRRPAAPAVDRCGLTLHTGIPMPQAHELAAKVGVSLASLLLAVYHRAICAAAGEREHLFFPMSANRHDERVAEMVTTLNQWVPLLLDLDPAEPLPGAAAKAHWRSFNALKHGVCDPDAIVAIRAEHADADPGYGYNAILAPPGFPSQDLPAPSRIEWYAPARATGPGFYLIARGLTSLDLIVRVHRPGWDRARVAAFAEAARAELDALR